MKSIKKVFSLAIATCLLLTSAGCITTNNNTDIKAQATTVSKVSASMLDGKVANFMEAEGFGIMQKKATPASSGANPYSVVTYDGESSDNQQKKTEFVKQTEDGVTDIRFHNVDDSAEKSYKELNKKYQKHHHETVECVEEDCDKISDEITQEEESGAVDTVLSLGARVNKLYTVGDFTFVSISSAVEGKINIIRHYSKRLDELGPESGFPTNVNIVDNLGANGYGFSWINVQTSNGKKGMIPIKVFEDEENYHKINYWSDEFNQSYIIDNATGLTCSLSQFNYIYSVSGGIIKIYDKTAPSGFVYYRPAVTNNQIVFNKIEFPANDSEFISASSSCRVLADIYGNMLFANNELKADGNGERKVASKMILAQKSQAIYDGLNNANDSLGANNYKKSNLYHNGSDGRIYRVNFVGDLNNISVSVLNESCEWQAVEKDISVDFSYAYVVWQVGIRTSQFDCLRLTCIIDGYAYFSTAAQSDGGRVWPQAYFENDYDYYIGVVKMPVDGFADGDTTIQDFIQEFAYMGVPNDRNYGVILVGKTQMLYFVGNTICLRDVSTGEENWFNGRVERVVPYKGGVLYIDGMGYIDTEEQLDLDTFGPDSFSAEPINTRDNFEEYYKLLKGIK